MKEIIYLCDRRACDKCDNNCEHTSDITHAVNFIKLSGLGAYFEIKQQEQECIPIDWIMEYPEKLKERIKTIDGLDLAQYIKMHQDLILYKTQLRIMVEMWKEESEKENESITNT